MIIFAWEKELETGVELIDQQHMQIMIAINRLLICRKFQDDRDRIDDCLRFLEQFIQYHFQAEEAFQVECGYVGFRAHQAEHNSIATQLRFIIVKLEASDYEKSVLEDFYQFLYDWVHQHILCEDVAFAKVYRVYAEEKSKI